MRGTELERITRAAQYAAGHANGLPYVVLSEDVPRLVAEVHRLKAIVRLAEEVCDEHGEICADSPGFPDWPADRPKLEALAVALLKEKP